MVRPGVLTTVQDRGRVGHRRFGVPVGGAFDRGAADLANALIGNPPTAAVLELTLVGGAYQAEVDLAVALAGAAMTAVVASLDGEPRRWAIPQTGTLRSGETLTLGGAAVGARSYLAVRGGWQTPVILGSRSAELPLRAGDRLAADPGTTTTRRPAPAVVAGFGSGGDPARPIRWIDGPDGDSTRLDGAYRVLNSSNRMGVRLEGAPVAVRADPNRLSMPVAPGAIQVAGGQPIILGVAGGTIGGYPHVGHVISADLDRVGQLRAGDLVGFERVSPAAARHLDAEQRQARVRWQTRLRVWADG